MSNDQNKYRLTYNCKYNFINNTKAFNKVHEKIVGILRKLDLHGKNIQIIPVIKLFFSFIGFLFYIEI